MFQVGDIVQVIIVPKKYKQYDIAGATGVVKTVYSNNIRIHISSYYNEESEEEYTHDLILHMNDLKDAGFKVEIPNNIYDMTSDYTRGMRTITLSSAEEKKLKLKK